MFAAIAQRGERLVEAQKEIVRVGLAASRGGNTSPHHTTIAQQGERLVEAQREIVRVGLVVLRCMEACAKNITSRPNNRGLHTY